MDRLIVGLLMALWFGMIALGAVALATFILTGLYFIALLVGELWAMVA